VAGQPRGGSTGDWRATLAGCAALLGVVLCGALASPVRAEECPNAGLRSGPGGSLPDCRAYEQVSPVEKAGADAVTVQSLFPAQSSACATAEPCSVVYMNGASAFDGSQGNELPNAYRSIRGPDGWETIPLTPPTLQAPANSRAKVSYAFSPDLSQAVLRVPLQQLTSDSPTGVYNLFARRADGGYTLVNSSAPPEAPPPGCGACFEGQDVPAFAGASADFSHVIFEANDSLVEGAPGEGVESLYETASGRVRLVGILPDGMIPAQGATAGGGIEAVEQHAGELGGAISQDGTRVLFQAAADAGGPDPQQAGATELFDRIGDGSSTVEVSAPAPGARPSDCETKEAICNPEPARFWAASADGSVVFFTSRAALTKDSYTGKEAISRAEREEEEKEEREKGTARARQNAGSDLYRYDVQSGSLTDLTADEAAGPNGASVLGVLGSSTDGSYTYFVATGRLGGQGAAGQANLYGWHEAPGGPGTVSFIATLGAPSSAEEANIEAARAGPGIAYHSDVADWSARPTESQAYVTPDGRHVAFMSVMRLTGYDNEDPITHQADHEVFEYSSDTGRLECASCDPSGSLPLGSAFIGARLTERMSTPFHQPRALSDDGSRLFFSSPDPLVSGLSGGSIKVFEYASGAVRLISGAGSGSDDLFLDASASGNDVFFATREPLAPSDTDELVDVYDARVDGGMPAPATIQPPCQLGTCQGPSSQQPSFPEPASVSSLGSGNLPPPTPSKPLTIRQRLARALAKCRKLKAAKRRSACIAATKRRYAPKARRAAGAGTSARPRP
jgi:hypothetical protein